MQPCKEYCLNERAPLAALAENAEIEVVQVEPRDRVIVQFRCPHGAMGRRSISWRDVDWAWLLAFMERQGGLEGAQRS